MPNRSDLHRYQQHAVKHIVENPACGLFLDMGLGKTVSTLTALYELQEEELAISRTLIIAPKRVAEYTWTAELDKWTHLRGLKAVKILGTEAQRRKAVSEEADLYVINRENIVWLVKNYGKQWRWDCIVIDELSSFKSHASQRFKALKAIRQKCNRIIGLTGTPSPNGYMDLWAEVYLLDGGERLGSTISKYRQTYFTEGRRSAQVVFDYKLREGSKKAIEDTIKDICISMSKEDFLTLPKCLKIDYSVSLSPNELKAYRSFERDRVLQLKEEQGEDKSLTAMSAATLCNALAQYASGAIYDEEKNVISIHDAKIEALAELVESAQSPVLIAYNYKHEKQRLLSALKSYKPRELNSEEDLRAWNAGEVAVLIGHPASMGHGLNIQAGGNIIIWFGLTWSLELYQQFNARLHRQGQTKPVMVYHLVVEETIERDMLKALESKGANQDALMKATKARLEKYL